MATSCSSELEQACGAIKVATHNTSVSVEGASSNTKLVTCLENLPSTVTSVSCNSPSVSICGTSSNTELVTSLESLPSTSTSVSCSSPSLSVGGVSSNTELVTSLTDGETNVQLLINSTAMGSTLTNMQQAQLDLGDVTVQGNSDIVSEDSPFSECNSGEELTSPLNGGDEGTDATDVSAPLGLPQTSLLFVNLPVPTQYVLIDPSRSQQLLRLRDFTQNAHASLISATQESIAREFVTKPTCTKPAGKRTYTNAAVNGYLELALVKGRQRFNAISTSNLEVYKLWDWCIFTYFIFEHVESLPKQDES